MMRKLIASFILAGVVGLFSTNYAKASEGIFELYSLTDRDYRCFVASIQRQNFSYNIAVTCRNLIYPADDDNIFGYIMWAQPINGQNPIKLGALGLGRAVFSTKTPFDYLFVTLERDNRARNPSNEIVMEGYLSRIEFLDEIQETIQPDEIFIDDFDDEPVEEVQELTSRQRLVTGLRRAAVIIFVLLVVTVATIFILTRKKR